MKTHILSILLAWAALATTQAADTDMTGKTVVFKTTKEGATGIYLDNSTLKVGSLTKASPELCSFKVTVGPAPGTVYLEAVGQPGFYLRHLGFHLVLLKDTNADSAFRIVPPLRGNQGVSIQAYTFPPYHLTVVDKDTLDFVKDIKDVRKAIFYLQAGK